MFGRKKKQRQQEVPDTSVRTHESGYIMRTGESLVLAQEATSPEGNGWLLATNKSLFFIHGSRGVYLYIDHGMIKSLGNEKGRITVKWLEKGRQFEFQMRLKDGFYTPDEAVNMLNTRFQYTGPALDHVEPTEKEIVEARKDRLERIGRILGNIRKEVNRLQKKKELDQKEQKDLKRFIYHQTVATGNEKCMMSMPFVRSAKVPARIPLTAVWNDCYFDDKRKLYVTFRKFRNGLGPKMLANQKELNPDGEGTVFPIDMVDFRYGYPAIEVKTEDGHYTASLLCTMAEEMITEELVTALLGTHVSWDNNEEAYMGRVWYETEATRWIGGSFFKLTDAEREKAIKHIPWLRNTNDQDIPWIKPYKIIQFDKEQAVKP